MDPVEVITREPPPAASQPMLAVAPAPEHGPRVKRAGAGLRALQPFAPAVIFALVTVFILVDFAVDIAGIDGPFHAAGMIGGAALSVTGLGLMLRMLFAARARSRELEVALDHTRADNVRWREQAAQMLLGVGALIDRQFEEWGLTPSEREVGLLLLKGLSLKSIADARSASEATVRQQAQSIYRKARLAGRAELSAFFLEDLLLPQTPGAALTPPPVARVPRRERARERV